MASLTGQTIASTYHGLLKTIGDNVNIPTGDTGMRIVDGEETVTALYLTDGNVGIGTATSLQAGLVIDNSHTVAYHATNSIVTTTIAESVALELRNSSESATTCILRLQTDYTNGSIWDIICQKTDADDGDLIFRTRNADDTALEAMRLDQNGYVGINEGAPSTRLHVNNSTDATTVCLIESTATANASNDVLLMLEFSGAGNADVSTAARFISFHDYNGEIGWCAAASASAMATAIQTSDVRFKEDIKDSAFEGLNTLNAIKMRDFTWNDKSRQSITGKKEICRWVADEVYEVYPDAVIGTPGQMKDTLDEDGNKIGEEIDQIGIADNIFIPIMMKAIQELSAKVTALENA